MTKKFLPEKIILMQFIKQGNSIKTEFPQERDVNFYELYGYIKQQLAVMDVELERCAGVIDYDT